MQWVHDNIANFGGDPDRVMIYGQSGGGSKVTTLMGMPSAAGLFHRASAQSGGGGNIPTKEQQREVARQMMKDLGLAPNDIASLQKMEWAKLIAAGNAAVAKINPPFRPGGRILLRTAARGLVADRRRQDHQRALVLRCRAGNFEECADADWLGQRRRQPDVSRPTEEEWHANLAKAYGDDKATALVAALKKAYPEKSIRTLSYMCSGAFGLNGLTMRNNVVKMAKLKHEQKAAPAYAYYFTWQSPMLDGVAGAWHTAELQFCFDNTKRCEQGTGNTPEAQALAKKMASLGEFCEDRQPQTAGDCVGANRPDTNKTMVWDNESAWSTIPKAKRGKFFSDDGHCA